MALEQDLENPCPKLCLAHMRYFATLKLGQVCLLQIHSPTWMSTWLQTSAGSIPGFVRYRSIPEFCSILDTYVVIKYNFHIEHSSQ